MPADSEILVGKAVTAATADTAYSTLVGVQADRFYSKVVDQTVMTKLAKRVFVDGPYLNLNTIDSSTKMAVGLSETAEISGTSDESAVTFSGRRLTPVSTRMLIKISQHRLQYVNIERGNINRTITDLMATEFGNHVEEICVKSENGGSDTSGGTGYLTEIDGWRALADSGNIYDHGGGYYNSLLFRKLWLNIPKKWRTRYADKSQWRFFVHSDCEMALRDLYAQRSTALGDDLLLGQDDVLRVLGIPLVSVPYIPSDVAGTLTQTGSSSTFTWVMLARPDNMIIGYRPEVKVYPSLNLEGNLQYVSFWAEWAPQFEIIEEVGVAVNVLNNVSY